MDDILKNLNKEQQEAARHIDGPLLIIAGAGSGKTRALTHRIAYLIASGIRPENILALTFTNKAAQEMKSRVFRLIDSATGKLPGFMGTFHSLAVKILRQEITKLGRSPDFSIYDENDSLTAIKEIMTDLAIDPKQFRPAGIANAISSQKNELISATEYQGQAKEFYEQLVAKVFIKYEEYLKAASALDFDDLLLLAVRLFKNHGDVLLKYQEKFKYILVDEYQDTNTAQYVFLKMLAEKYKNLCVVGDDWQCLVPETQVSTPNGPKDISKIMAGENIISANGISTISTRVAQKIKSRYRGQMIKIVFSNGKTIKTTPNHIFFARMELNPKVYFVYLMYSARFGYRIGVAKGARNSGKKIEIGLRVRANQERADKMWVLKIMPTKEKAAIHEHLISIKYSIPTIVFSAAKNRSMRITQKMIDFLYKEIPTIKNVQKLFQDFLLYENYPHFLPKGTTRKNSKISKMRINITLFGDNRTTQAAPWGLSRIAINTSHSKLKKELIKQGWSVRKGKVGTWRIELSRRHYSEAEAVVNKITQIATNCGVLTETVRGLKVKTGVKKYMFYPASHLLTNMVVPSVKNGSPEELKVKSIEREFYDGPVYDLDVPNTHNYIAENIVVHNSIYGFRNADFRNILNFEKDYPQAKIVLLEENYRSSQNILNAAHAVIQKNVYKTNKNLWTKKGQGEKVKIIEADSELEESYFIVTEIKNILSLGKTGARDLSDFTVLYRTNAQSRAIEEAIIQEGWPYRMVGALKFYERREIKDVISYLRLIQNPDDILSLKRIINIPARGIGKTTLSGFIFASELYQSTNSKIATFTQLMAEFRQIASIKKLSDLIKTILEKIKYQDYLSSEEKPDESRWENVQELIGVSAKFDTMAPGEGLRSFLEEIALTMSTDDISNERGQINLMTLHSAKGLEFPVVFIAGAEEGLLPHSRSIFDPQQMEEERRLCYVGITRAKEKIYLIFTRHRSLYGKTQSNLPSRFLNDIPEHLVEFESC